MRLIDADALKEKFDAKIEDEHVGNHLLSDIGFGVVIARSLLLGASTVDPVKHGHWTDENECSVCGTKGLCSVQEIREVYDYDCTEKTGYEVDIKFFKTDYCPNCGASMEKVSR